MANTNITRSGNTMQKKGVSVMVLNVDADAYADFDAADNYLIGYLPPNAVVTNAYVHTLVVSDAGAITVGTAEAGTEILSAGDSTTLGKTGTFTGQVATGSGAAVYVATAAAATTGEFLVVVEYLEYTKNTGEYTKVTNV